MFAANPDSILVGAETTSITDKHVVNSGPGLRPYSLVCEEADSEAVPILILEQAINLIEKPPDVRSKENL